MQQEPILSIIDVQLKSGIQVNKNQIGFGVDRYFTFLMVYLETLYPKKTSESDQKMPQSNTADHSLAPPGRDTHFNCLITARGIDHSLLYDE